MMHFKLNNGVKMPMLGLGVSQIAPDTDGIGVVLAALEAGYRAFDTAEFYGNEDMVGEGIRQSGIAREEIFVTTKVHNEAQRAENGAFEAFERSLKNLGLDYIDLYLIHWPVPGRYIQTYKALEKIYKSGRARAIGVCNCKIHHLQELEKIWEIPAAVNQYEHHPFLTQKEILEYCQKKEILVTAYCPQGRGRLGLHENPVITALAAKYNKTPAQIILRWNMDIGVSAIPKTVNHARLKENIDIFDFQLTDDDITAINALNTGTRVIRDPDDLTGY
ncbi:MAG: aldo/keto reductase [Clostridiales bacterium]|jgi:diketogulonate reductase-like aldo/keto reductase|nr:aldo/keto reductase [Clostridiales bacterium]